MKKEKKKVVFDEESKDDVDIDDIDLESFGSKKKKKKKRGGTEKLDIIYRFIHKFVRKAPGRISPTHPNP